MREEQAMREEQGMREAAEEARRASLGRWGEGTQVGAWGARAKLRRVAVGYFELREEQATLFVFIFQSHARDGVAEPADCLTSV